MAVFKLNEAIRLGRKIFYHFAIFAIVINELLIIKICRISAIYCLM